MSAPPFSPPVEIEGRALRVLAAEDNAVNRLVLTTMTAVFGVELTMVEDGAKAVDAWRAGAFDMILMDIQMPEMDGLTATRAIRAAEGETGRPRTPIVALSAHITTAAASGECIAAGVDLCVPKPIDLARLHAALTSAAALGQTARCAA